MMYVPLDGLRELVLPIVLFVALLFSGCASLEASWYGCDTGRVRPYDYMAECQRLRAEAIEAGAIRVQR